MKQNKNRIVNLLVSTTLGVIAVALGTTPVKAQIVTLGVYSTGMSTVYSASTQTAFSSGTADTPWTIVSNPSGTAAAASLVTNPNSAWVANTNTSKWISNVTDSTVNASAYGNYDFQTSFNIASNINLSTVQIQFAYTSDNDTTAVLFDGASTGISNAGTFNAYSGTQTINSSNASFHAGTNMIDFIVNNASTTANPMGLNVVFTSATGSTAPEPGSVGLMLLGVTGLFARCGRLRHRSAVK